MNFYAFYNGAANDCTLNDSPTEDWTSDDGTTNDGESNYGTANKEKSIDGGGDGVVGF